MDYSWIGSTVVAIIGVCVPAISKYVNDKNQIENEHSKILYTLAEENYKKEMKLFDNFCISLANLKADLDNKEYRSNVVSNFYSFYPYLFFEKDTDDDAYALDYSSGFQGLIDVLSENDVEIDNLDYMVHSVFSELDRIRSMIFSRFNKQINLNNKLVKSTKRKRSTTSSSDSFFQKFQRNKKQ